MNIKKLSTDILQVIATYLRKNREFSFCSLTKIELTPDKRMAKVYWDTFDLSKKEELSLKLKEITPKLRTEIARQLPAKYTPIISLIYDSSFEDGHRIEELLQDNE